MKTKIYLLLALFFAGCATNKSTVTIPAQSENVVVNGKLFTALFQQKAAEYKALCYQAYNIAHLRLHEALQQPHTKPAAVITDIDETVLDNSPYAVHQGLLGKDYDPATWNEWTAKAMADTVPGAFTFFSYAASKNVEVFYLTNRSEKERAVTLQNLQRFHFPNADDAHLLLRTDVSTKEPRRQSVMETHDVLLLTGDNLADFTSAFDNKTFDSRLTNVQQLNAQFGNRFIMLPNANYGDWESALYNSKMTNAQKDSAIKAELKSF